MPSAQTRATLMGLRDQLYILDSRISAMEPNSTTGPAIYATPTAVPMTGGAIYATSTLTPTP